MIKRYLAITLILPTIAAIFIYSVGPEVLGLKDHIAISRAGLIFLSTIVSAFAFTHILFNKWIFYFLFIVILSYFAFVSDIKVMKFFGFLIWVSGLLVLKAFDEKKLARR